MRICVLSTTYPRFKGDSWVPFTHSLTKELARKHDIKVITSSDIKSTNFEIRDKIKIYRFSYFFPQKLQTLTYKGGMLESYKNSFLAKLQIPFFLISFFFKALKYSKNCDILHAYWSLSGLIAIWVSKFRKKPIILTLHGAGIRSLPRWLNRYVVRNVDVIATAHHELIDIVKSLGRTKAVCNIKNPLDYDRFEGEIKTIKLKREFNLKNEFIVSFIGRLEPMKDPLTFVKSIPHVVKKIKNVKFFIVGNGHLSNDVKELVKKLKISKYVFITGLRDDTNAILKVSDLFIAISPLENCFSTTIIEAMILKVPCIITKAGYTGKFFTHKKDCFLINKKDERQLANSIVYLLKNNDSRKKIISNGLIFLKRNGFERKVIINQYNSIYKKLIRPK